MVSFIFNNRLQATVINNNISSWVTVRSGIPQVLLGPLLLIVFVNDIDLHRSHETIIDTRVDTYPRVNYCVSRIIRSSLKLTNIYDAEKLQADLVRLKSYCVDSEFS